MISIFEKDLLYYQKLKRRSLQFAALHKKIKSELALIQNDSIHDLSKAISEMKVFEDAISLHGKNAKEIFQGQAGTNHYGVIQKLIYDHSIIKNKAEDLFDVCF